MRKQTEGAGAARTGSSLALARVKRRIRLTSAAIALFATIGTATVGAVAAAEDPGKVTAGAQVATTTTAMAATASSSTTSPKSRATSATTSTTSETTSTTRTTRTIIVPTTTTSVATTTSGAS